ncbi:hypothetical protein HPP92_004381 [Vanilla planifolia]|uniref:Uncharacterized protein n=1 Tax=Vanilla planifolia TaxID=51239 RepID=A0A835VC87_VANPL|nr:hypothetical protein HPP92_004381 [Vanilla planifolia]
MESDDDSDAPEELTAEQGVKQDEHIRKVQRENKIRVAQESKERRRQWSQRRNQPKTDKESVSQNPEQEAEEDVNDNPAIPGMLPSHIINFLAEREKNTFASDSEEEVMNPKLVARKKKKKSYGTDTVLLKEIPPAPCLENSIEFLKRRKLSVSRSNSVLKNAHQALRLLSAPGNLLSKS